MQDGMGGCLTLDREEAKARRRSEEIDKQLGELAKQERNVIKILLLGAGESGKSTLVKQMKIIHSDGFTKEELRSFRPTVMDNLLSSMKYVLTGMGLLRINLQSAKNKAHAQTVLISSSCFDKSFNILPNVAMALQALWQDRGVRLAVARGYEYELNDSAIYLFENMERICNEKYVPTPTDVLRARVRTNGIIETHFKINDVIIRRKWIYCFDDVRAVMFVVSLSGYDMTLVEDPTVNRLEESLNLFSQIVNNRFFREASFVLFLNKFDLFRPDYDVDRGALFIQHKFALRNQNSAKVIYPHFTTATDTSNIQVVFQVVMDTVIRENLHQVTLL
ncbi:Guanine nucleotide-binding protein G(o) subunit alpha [Blattella germanica]|nr:Guanine nucleotide-binding protein G(o) subunit alpha [Blattella germanica]